MKNFMLAIALILTSGVVHADPRQASCASIINGIQGGITLQFDDQSSNAGNFRLFFMSGEMLIASSSGNFKIGGGDGMMMATLIATFKDGTQAQRGTMRWWQEPAMTPNLLLIDGTHIPLKCTNLPGQDHSL